MTTLLSRRGFHSACIGGAAASYTAAARGQDKRPPRILLRSSWQTVNIGDVGHTPGVLRLLEEHLPDAEVRLWPSMVADGVEGMLRRRFPKLSIIKGPDALQTAIGSKTGQGSGCAIARKEKNSLGIADVRFHDTFQSTVLGVTIWPFRRNLKAGCVHENRSNFIECSQPNHSR